MIIIIITIVWIVTGLGLIGAIVVREPNVESLGAMIQDSMYRDLESESSIDKTIIILSVFFIFTTTALFIQYK